MNNDIRNAIAILNNQKAFLEQAQQATVANEQAITQLTAALHKAATADQLLEDARQLCESDWLYGGPGMIDGDLGRKIDNFLSERNP